MTLLDYPGKIAATIFLKGCNFRCPFCHNASLVLENKETLELEETDILDFLTKRQGLLEGVCISGGEPLLQKEIKGFLAKIKELGYPIKLDTNGGYPTLLKKLVAEGLIDYVAMDIKNSPAKYAQTIGSEFLVLSKIKESIAFLLDNPVEYEFRTTIVKELHTKEDLIEIGKWIQGAQRYFLQNFVDSGDLIQTGLHGVSQKELLDFASVVREYIPNVSIRN